MKILFQGDTHGSMSSINLALVEAQKNECDMVLVVGDFGYGWDDGRFLRKCNKAATSYEIPIYWIDGNHENFDRLEEHGMFKHGPIPVHVKDQTGEFPMVRYIPRGTAFGPKDCSILCLGGAYSIDCSHRVIGKSWWPQETITYQDVVRTLHQAEVHRPKILVTHDMPDWAFTSLMESDAMWVPHIRDKDKRAAASNRGALEQVYLEADPRPKLWVHGHYHYRYEMDGPLGTHIIGLAHEQDPEARLVIDTEEWM